MREIKFRAWHPETKVMFDWQDMQSYRFNLFLDRDNFILMQYTGFKDKNGKEIYEGDILQVDCSNRVIEVAWRSGSWVANYQGEYLCPLMGVPGIAGYTSGEIEIIGNIYENPELKA